MELGTFLLLIAFAYGIGVFWYDLLPGKLAERPWRGAAYPFVGIVLMEAAARPDWVGPAFGGLHLMPLFVGSLLGVVVDWRRRATGTRRRPSRPSCMRRLLDAAAW